MSEVGRHQFGYEEVTQDRDAVLRALLPYDYDYARESGLIDKFYYDPNTGEDGLLHMLSGSIVHGENGSVMAQGFHHEPSAEVVWRDALGKDASEPSPTRVDRTHLEGANSKRRRPYREFRSEPFLGRVVVGGHEKFVKQLDPETGEQQLAPAKNSMYPNEYDALAVMQAVCMAYENRDVTKDEPTVNDVGHKVYTNVGYATMLDETSQMPIRLVIDAETMKIMTAMPLIEKEGSIMNLSKEDEQRHMYL